jgi:TonB-linked SusC/RagA family outer membrane protein
MLTYRILQNALLAAAMLLGSALAAQTVSLSVKKEPLEKVLAEIRKQTGYSFVYVTEEVKKASPVTVTANGLLKDVLQQVFSGQPLDFVVEDKVVIISARAPATRQAEIIYIFGRVVNDKNEGIPGASIVVGNGKKARATDESGRFTLLDSTGQTLRVSSVGYQPAEVLVKGKQITIRLQTEIANLDESIVIAYGTTTRKLNTGSVTRVTGEEIRRQPVTDVLATLQGRVPGMVITQGSGVAGSAFSIEVRGRTSLDPLLSGNDPLLVIDGITFETGNMPLSQIASALNNPKDVNQGGMSPLSTINPAEIESIEVLKDADATAIYGSRGANGVLLITTRKGRAGRPRISAGVYAGRGKSTNTLRMLDTRQYIDMRKEAFVNDRLVPDTRSAPDLLLWDTTRSADFRELLTGGAAHMTDAYASVSGGSDRTRYYLNTAYHKEGSVFPGDFGFTRKTVRLSADHGSADKKLLLSAQAAYASGRNRLPQTDLSFFLNLPPNMILRDSAGGFAWEDQGVPFSSFGFSNPLASLLKEYTLDNEFLSGSFQAAWEILPGWKLRAVAGYNSLSVDEVLKQPQAAFSPASNPKPHAHFADRTLHSWMAEPRLEWNHKIGRGRIDVLLGSTWQERRIRGKYITAIGYTDDHQLGSPDAAGSISLVKEENLHYRYTAVFGRLHYNRQDKYLLNLTARYDGSSRFGPASRFAPFGAVGTAWIFSNEKFFMGRMPFLSFGKLRASYGFTGNDQVGDYRFVDTWVQSSNSYQGVPALRPSRLFNEDYNWELTRKLEAALETGFLKDRLLLSLAFYRHRSTNQLAEVKLPIQAGFSVMHRNIPALVENTGLELQLQTKNITTPGLSWSSSFHLTLPRNRLLSFPGLSSSSYASTYEEGRSLRVIKKYRFLGLDPVGGTYLFEDVNHDGALTITDRQVLGHLDPQFFGGLQNSVVIGRLRVDVFMEFKKQTGTGYLASQYLFHPGIVSNQPSIVLDRWQAAGDQAGFQRFTTRATGAIAMAALRLPASNAVYTDASYLRVKNVSLAYDLPLGPGPARCQLYLRGQNLWTFTGFAGPDPETQNINRVPPLRTIVAGLQIDL